MSISFDTSPTAGHDADVWKIIFVMICTLLVGHTAAGASAAETGLWVGPTSWPFAPTHAVVLRDGNVLLWSDFGGAPLIWNPTTQLFSTTPDTLNTHTAVTQLSNGDIAAIGGRDSVGVSSPSVRRFEVTTNSWLHMPSLVTPRFDATSLSLINGMALALSGEQLVGQFADMPEIAFPDSTWQSLILAQLAMPAKPWAFTSAPDHIVVVGPDATTRRLGIGGLQGWEVLGSMISVDRNQGTAVRLPGFVDRFMVMGGRDPATSTCEILSLPQSSFWRLTTSMTHARRHHNATILADGTVLVSGGTLFNDDSTFAVLQSELFDPILETWQLMDSLNVSRRRGSIALLLPDATVLVAGGGDGVTEVHANSEIFFPPYLFRGLRPVISNAPPTITYANSFVVTSPQASNILEVWLVGSGSVSSGFNSGQRAVKLGFGAALNALTINAPDSAAVAPMGGYMLFLIDDSGIPSQAAMITVEMGAPIITPPTITSSPSLDAALGTRYTYIAQASGDLPLTWSLLQGPAWMGVDSANGIVFGTPDSMGSVDAILQATNAGGTSQQPWTLVVGPDPGAAQVVIPLGATWRYHKGLSDPGATWANLGFDDSSWLQGASGFGFSDNDDATILSDMRNNYSTVYTRKTFLVSNAPNTSLLSVLYNYDDGFAVYLNGNRFFSLRAPTEVTHTSTATGSHEALGALVRHDVSDPLVLGWLQEGLNTLAVVGLNVSAKNSDFTLKVALEITGGTTSETAITPNPLQVSIDYPNPIEGAVLFRIRIPSAGSVAWSLFDVAGKRVQFTRRDLSGGWNTLLWNGRDDRGRPAPQGVYFYKLRTPFGDYHGKVTKLKSADP